MKTKRVLITGTTSGIGRALLRYYVQRGAEVICVNRRRIAELESEYPTVRFECVDVRSAEQVQLLLAGLVAEGTLPDTFILNAGINRMDNDQSFALAAYRAVVDTNLYGVLNFVGPLTEFPSGPSPCHLVAISSMASYVGNPYGLGYHTSKAALSACFRVWSRMYAGTDLVFQQVMLGPVRTPIYTMAERFPRWMVRVKEAFSGSMDNTASAIARFAESRKPTLHYPKRAIFLYLGMWLCRLLIPGLLRGRQTLAGQTRRGSGPSAIKQPVSTDD